MATVVSFKLPEKDYKLLRKIAEEKHEGNLSQAIKFFLPKSKETPNFERIELDEEMKHAVS